MIAKHEKEVKLCWMNSEEQYGSGSNYKSMDRSMSTAYPQYQSGFHPPPPPIPCYQYNNSDPIFAPKKDGYPPHYDPMFALEQYGYPPQLPYC